MQAKPWLCQCNQQSAVSLISWTICSTVHPPVHAGCQCTIAFKELFFTFMFTWVGSAHAHVGWIGSCWNHRLFFKLNDLDFLEFKTKSCCFSTKKKGGGSPTNQKQSQKSQDMSYVLCHPGEKVNTNFQESYGLYCKDASRVIGDVAPGLIQQNLMMLWSRGGHLGSTPIFIICRSAICHLNSAKVNSMAGITDIVGERWAMLSE